MKKDQFKTFVKEIIREVISEIDNNDDNGPVDMTDVPSPTARTDKKWRGKMRTLDAIKNEPELKNKLNVSKKVRDLDNVVEPPPRKK